MHLLILNPAVHIVTVENKSKSALVLSEIQLHFAREREKEIYIYRESEQEREGERGSERESIYLNRSLYWSFRL